MSRVLYIIDPGHGGLHPNTGKYVTAGKRSPLFEDGSCLYEGVNNRINAKLIVDELNRKGLDAIDIVNTWHDVSLTDRVRRANELAKDRDCLYISVHSDAFGNGWTDPSGITVFNSKGQTKSDEFAKIIHDDLACNFRGVSKNRGIKESNFYVLRHTSMPAVLLELGFHSNRAEAELMQTDKWRELVVKSVVDACLTWD